MWTIGLYLDFPRSGKWVETLFRAEGAGAYSILRYVNGEVGRLPGQVIGLAMEDPRWSRRGARGPVLLGLADDQIGRLREICGGFRNREALEVLDRNRPELSMEERVRVARAFVKGAGGLDHAETCAPGFGHHYDSGF